MRTEAGRYQNLFRATLTTTIRSVNTEPVSTAFVLLGLLARGPCHGYELKREHDARLPRARPVAFGQVYATIGRLMRDGLIDEAGQGKGVGPERMSYALTEQGRAHLAGWLGAVEEPLPHVQSTVLTKVIVMLFGSDDAKAARAYLDAQRQAHLDRMRELTRQRSDPHTSMADRAATDYAIEHLNADVRWMQTTLDRVEAMHREMARP